MMFIRNEFEPRCFAVAARLRKWHMVVLCVLAGLVSVRPALAFPPEGASQAEAKAAGYVVADDFRNSGMRGVNIGSGPGPIPMVKYGELSRLGAKVVRFQLSLNRCDNCTSYSLSDVQIANIEKLAQMGRTGGFRVIIGLNVKTKINSRDEYWFTDALRQSIVENWKALATRFKDDTAIAAFDLLNEPFPPGPVANPTLWLDFASELIRAIREVDPYHVIVVEGAPHARTLAFLNMKALPFPNLVYGMHFYEPFELTHQGVDARFPKGVAYPTPQKWDKAFIDKQLQPVRDFATKNNVPIIVGEFSCVRWSPGDSRYLWLKDVIDAFEANGWSWAYHAFREWDGWNPEIVSNDPQDQSVSWDSPVMQLLRGQFRKGG